MRAFRVLAAVLAALIAAGFAIGIRQAHSVNAVTSLLGSGKALTPAQQRSAASDLSSAKFAYPGQDVQILAASVALNEHRYAYALSLARSINRAEPDNLQGWITLAAAALNSGDRRDALRARQEEIRLDPIDARAQ